MALDSKRYDVLEFYKLHKFLLQVFYEIKKIKTLVFHHTGPLNCHICSVVGLLIQILHFQTRDRKTGQFQNPNLLRNRLINIHTPTFT